MAKYAINGFGRIGRNVLRAMSKEERNKVVAINDLTPIETIAHLLKYDSTQGKFDGEISIEGDYLVVDGHKILITAICAVSTRLVPLSMLHFCRYLCASGSAIRFRSIKIAFAVSIAF